MRCGGRRGLRATDVCDPVVPRAIGADIGVERRRNSRGLIEVSIGNFILKIDDLLLFIFIFFCLSVYLYIFFCKICHDFQNKREEIYLTFPISLQKNCRYVYQTPTPKKR